MNITHRIITFASGDWAWPVNSAVNLRVRAVREATDGDWKTNLARGTWPTIPAGTEATVVKIWQNFEGMWCTIVFDDKRIDVRPLDLQLLAL